MRGPQSHVIRKYANRKLYDTTTRRYTSLSGIWELVCSGHDVTVTDHENGDDITAVVLSQIVASHERQTAIEKTEEVVQARRDTLLDYLLRTIGRPAAAVGDEVGRRGSELAAELSRWRSEMEETVEVAVSRTFENLNFSSRRDLSQLRRRVEDLEQQVAKVQAALQTDLESEAAAKRTRAD